MNQIPDAAQHSAGTIGGALESCSSMPGASFEHLVSNISARFIDLPARELDRAIEQSLTNIRVALGVDRTTLTRFHPKTGQEELTHSVAVEGVEPVARTRSVRERNPWALAMATANKPVVFAQLDDLPPEADVDKETYRQIGLRSHVTMPIMVDGHLHGGLSFGCVRGERIWADEVLARMRLLAELFGSTLARKQIQAQLEEAIGFERLYTSELGPMQWHERLAHIVKVHAVAAASVSLANEINQPLGAIENYALAARSHLEAPSPDLGRVVILLDKVIAQATRAGDAAANMRCRTRLDHGDPRPLDLEQVLGYCVSVLAPDFAQRDIHIEVVAEGPLPPAFADQLHLQQVALDLLQNAREAIERSDHVGSKAITVSLRCFEQEQIHVEIADQGCGIPDGDLERIFDPSCTEEASNLGAGLAVCRQLIQSQGGTLWASHNPGGGALFHFTLPVATIQ